MIIVDTNVLSEAMRGCPNATVMDWIRSRDRDSVGVTSVTVYELLTGVYRLPDGARKDRLRAGVERLLETHRSRILHYDTGSARVHARIRAERQAQGHPLGSEDGMIAAICLHHNVPLATRNVSDFRDLGLTLVNPWVSPDPVR